MKHDFVSVAQNEILWCSSDGVLHNVRGEIVSLGSNWKRKPRKGSSIMAFNTKRKDNTNQSMIRSLEAYSRSNPKTEAAETDQYKMLS